MLVCSYRDGKRRSTIWVITSTCSTREAALASLTTSTIELLGPLLRTVGAPELIQERDCLDGAMPVCQSVFIAHRLRQLDPNYDLFVGHWLLPWGLLAPSEIPVHLYAHGSDIALLESLPKAMGRFVARRIDRRARGITFVSEDLAKRFQHCLKRPAKTSTSICPMGVDEPQPNLEEHAKWQAIKGDRTLILSVGRLVKIKDYDTLIEASKDLPNLLLVIAGDGPEHEHLQALAARLGVDLWLVGNISAETRQALLTLTDLYVSTSTVLKTRQEGTPVSVLEALNMGCPCALTSTGGLTDLASKTQQFLFASQDTHALHQELKRFCIDRVYVEARRHRAQQEINRWGWSEVISDHEASLVESASSVERLQGLNPQKEVQERFARRSPPSTESTIS